jgi:hypothetical protein
VDGLIDFVLSPTYVAITRNLAIVAVLFAVVATITAFAFYGRGREGSNDGGPPWALLVGTLRDSFIITLLYTADSLIAQSSSIQAFGSDTDPFKVGMSVAASLSGPVFQILVLAVAVLRVSALSRWLKSQNR